MKYFGYGSNLDIDDLENWCQKRGERIPKLVNPTIMELKNYTIGFTRKSITRGGGVADIIPNEGESCFGVIFDVSEDDFKILDKKEGVKIDGGGAYRRLILPNNIITYEVVNKESEFIPPTNEYLDAIIKGANEFSLPKKWIGELKSFKNKLES